MGPFVQSKKIRDTPTIPVHQLEWVNTIRVRCTTCDWEWGDCCNACAIVRWEAHMQGPVVPVDGDY